MYRNVWTCGFWHMQADRQKDRHRRADCNTVHSSQRAVQSAIFIVQQTVSIRWREVQINYETNKSNLSTTCDFTTIKSAHNNTNNQNKTHFLVKRFRAPDSPCETVQAGLNHTVHMLRHTRVLFHHVVPLC